MRDLLAYLKVFLNPDDDVSLLRIANVPARGLSDATMERLLAASQERQGSVFDVMKNPVVLATFQAKARESIEAFIVFIEHTQSQLTEESAAHIFHTTIEAPTGSSRRGEEADLNSAPVHPPPHVGGHEAGEARALQSWAWGFLAEIGYLDELRRSEKNAETAENRVRNLQDLAASMDGNPSLPPFQRLQSFLEELMLDNDREEEPETAGDAVTLITMHSCKGLEFPHVYIVGLEDGLLPHTRSKAEGTLDEERRLFYVALTRAMQGLTISHCVARRKYGQLIPCHPSPFLNELPPELVERTDGKFSQPVAVEAGKGLFAAMRSALE